MFFFFLQKQNDIHSNLYNTSNTNIAKNVKGEMSHTTNVNDVNIVEYLNIRKSVELIHVGRAACLPCIIFLYIQIRITCL